jgi:putative methionine-R-sulfoxide reductase with GAF domain
VIGRALRKRAPQVVPEVEADPEYHRDVEGVRSEMVVPLLEDGEAVGAIDFQSDRPAAFGLDDVAAGETLADFLVLALRNARRNASRGRGQ